MTILMVVVMLMMIWACCLVWEWCYCSLMYHLYPTALWSTPMILGLTPRDRPEVTRRANNERTCSTNSFCFILLLEEGMELELVYYIKPVLHNTH